VNRHQELSFAPTKRFSDLKLGGTTPNPCMSRIKHLLCNQSPPTVENLEPSPDQTAMKIPFLQIQTREKSNSHIIQRLNL